MNNAKRSVVQSVEQILISLPHDKSSWEERHARLAGNVIQAQLDLICGLQTPTATARRMKRLRDEAIALDAQEAGEVA